MRKGIVLAGGRGTRLFPVTQVISKQLLPVFDKPMIYYPLSILMLAGIQEVLIISTPEDTPLYKSLLGNGDQWGMAIKYKVQPTPGGLAQALILGEDFIENNASALILGDNIFYGSNLKKRLLQASEQKNGSTIFAYQVSNPTRYGVVEFNLNQEAISIEEKPLLPKSKYAVTGLYFYDKNAVNYAKILEPSSRGELEITDLNRLYLTNQALRVEVLDRGYTWLDTGTHESLLEASLFISSIQKRQGKIISSPEEIAYRNGWISRDDVVALGKKLSASPYGAYLINMDINT